MNVLLIHGLSRTPASMWGLASFLRSHGYTPHFFGYWAWKNSYPSIVEQLRSRLTAIAQQGRFSIVAHSLGGVLSRAALFEQPQLQPQHLVMLGTPNQPPRLAPIAWNIPLFQWVTQECGHRLSQNQFYHELPPLNCDYTIIAGTSGPRGHWSPFGNELNDGIVSLEETKIHENDAPLQFPTFHTFMMNDNSIQEQIHQILCKPKNT